MHKNAINVPPGNKLDIQSEHVTEAACPCDIVLLLCFLSSLYVDFAHAKNTCTF